MCVQVRNSFLHLHAHFSCSWHQIYGLWKLQFTWTLLFTLYSSLSYHPTNLQDQLCLPALLCRAYKVKIGLQFLREFFFCYNRQWLLKIVHICVQLPYLQSNFSVIIQQIFRPILHDTYCTLCTSRMAKSFTASICIWNLLANLGKVFCIQ